MDFRGIVAAGFGCELGDVDQLELPNMIFHASYPYFLAATAIVTVLISTGGIANAFLPRSKYEFEVVEVVEVGKAVVRYRARFSKEWKTAVVRFMSSSDFSRGPNVPPRKKCDESINKDANAVSAFRKLIPTEFTSHVVTWQYPTNRPILEGRPELVNIISFMGEYILQTMEEAGLYCPPSRQ